MAIKCWCIDVQKVILCVDRDFDVEDGKLGSFLQYFIKLCAQELVKQKGAEPPKCSCLIGAINTCQDYLYDAELLRNIAKKDKTLCCSD